jgi:molecular chaperone GrpE
MNRKTRAEERMDALDTSPAALAAAQVEAVRVERDEAVAKAQAERDEYLAALQRERAEFTNFRRRTTDERQQERGLAGVDLITKVLVLADDFDRAIETRPADLAENAWIEGIAAIDRKLRILLESEGVTAVEAIPGTPFDPREHEAVVGVPGTGRAEGEIVEEVRRGYRLRDRLIRPALVAVAAPDPNAPADPTAGPGPGAGPGFVN